MQLETALLYLVTAAVMLECCYATPASFDNGDDEREFGRERRSTARTRSGTRTQTVTAAPQAETTAVTVTDPSLVSLLQQVINSISNFLTNVGTALTNCVTTACLPFDAGTCFTCIALSIAAGLGK